MAREGEEKKNADEAMDFETALERLEKIVEELESGQLGLEESLEKFGEAMRLSAYCEKKLREAEAKVQEYVAAAEQAAGKAAEDEELDLELHSEQEADE